MSGGGGPVGIYNFRLNQFATWQAALARVSGASGRARFIAVGESVVRGEYAGDTGQWDNAKANSWTSKLRDYLSGLGYPAVTEDLFSSGGNAGVVPMSALRNVYKPGFNAASGWAQSGSTGFGGCLLINSTDGNALTFTPQVDVDTFEIWDITSASAGVIQYNVDGGANTTLTQTDATVTLRRTQIDAGTPGAHTLNISRVSGTGFLIGVRAWNSEAPAIDFINGGRGGATAALLNNSAAVFAYKPHLTTLAASADAIGIQCTINDTIAGTVGTTYKSGMNGVIAACKSGGASVFLMTGNPVNTANATDEVQQQFRQYCYDLADENDIGLIDLHQIYQNYATMQANGFATNALHPNKAFYADLVSNHLGPIMAQMGGI